MRIRCSSLLVPDELLRPAVRQLQGRWPVTLGAEYDVVALRRADGLWHATFEHAEREMPVSAPLVLFGSWMTSTSVTTYRSVATTPWSGTER
jgi:hypothetical protein